MKVSNQRHLLRIAIFITCAILTDTARAETFARVFFIANQGMISIYRPQSGGSDADAKALFDAMDVPVQGSVLGPGKGIKDSNQILSWVCADRGQPGFHCSITIQGRSGSGLATTIVRDNPVHLRYEATGALATELSKLLKPNVSDGTFNFVNAEGTLSIQSSAQATGSPAHPAHFVIEYRE